MARSRLGGSDSNDGREPSVPPRHPVLENLPENGVAHDFSLADGVHASSECRAAAKRAQSRLHFAIAKVGAL